MEQAKVEIYHSYRFLAFAEQVHRLYVTLDFTLVSPELFYTCIATLKTSKDSNEICSYRKTARFPNTPLFSAK